MSDKPGFAAAEPVVATTLAGGAVAFVLSLLVTHGVITTTDASTLTQEVVPPVAGFLVLCLGFIARRFVKPVRAVEHDLEAAGVAPETIAAAESDAVAYAIDELDKALASWPSTTVDTGHTPEHAAA